MTCRVVPAHPGRVAGRAPNAMPGRLFPTPTNLGPDKRIAPMATNTCSSTARKPALIMPRTTGLSRTISDLGHVLSGWYSNLQSWRQQRRDIAHLHELPDYLLEDIGLTREEIFRLGGRRPNPRWNNPNQCR